MTRILASLLALLLLAAPALAQNPSPAQWQGTRTSGDGVMFLNSGKGVTLQDATNASVAFPRGIQMTGPISFSGTRSPANSSLWVVPSATVTGTCSQAGPGNDTWCDLNRMAVTDQINSSNGRAVYQLNMVHNLGGGSTAGQFGGLSVLVQQTGAVSNANNPGIEAVQFLANANGSMGGAPGTESGNVWGINTNVVLGASATSFKQVIGEETDLAVNAAASVLYLDGSEVALTPAHGAAASIENSGFIVTASGKTTSNGGTIPGLTVGYAFGGFNGYNPMDASATLIGAVCHTNNCGSFPPGTVAHGVDFSAYAFSSDAFKSPGFRVDGSGNVTANSIITATYAGSAAATVIGTVNGTAVRLIDSGVTPINWLQITPGQAGSGVQISCGGPSSDTNVGCVISSKGTGLVQLNNGANRTVQLTAIASAVNFFNIQGGIAGNPPLIQASGTDPNINLELAPKGTGVLQFANTPGVTCAGTPTASFASTGGLVTHC